MNDPNRKVWEREYGEFKLIVNSLEDRPQSGLACFLRWLKEEQKIDFKKWRVLELGSGSGRNANYLASIGCAVTGLEFSQPALALARKRAEMSGVEIDYLEHDIGRPYPVPANYFNLVLDITSSNSLDEKGREIYLREVKRVLQLDSWFFLRALCKDGDKNVKELLKRFPGPERDTYIMPELGLVERVFSKEDLEKTYGQYFKLAKLTRESQYVKFNNRRYKRYYWVAYLKND